MGSPILKEITTEEDVISSEPQVLRTVDRCDQCSAQAFVIVTSPTSKLSLLMCGHHYSRSESVFASTGWLVDDQRFLINKSPSQSSGVADDD
jgi:hypothetical protein